MNYTNVKLGPIPSSIPDNKHILLFVSIITTIAMVYAMKDEERFSILKKDFTNPIFLVSFFVICVFTVWGLSTNDSKTNKAIEKAIIAFITAYLAHLNMSFVVFFIIAIFAYYFGSNS